MTEYEMCIANIARKIRSGNPENSEITAFDYAYGIAAGFCKIYEEVVLDIIQFVEPS